MRRIRGLAGRWSKRTKWSREVTHRANGVRCHCAGSRTFLAYHPQSYVEETLLAPFEQLSGPESALNQTVYVARKPAG